MELRRSLRACDSNRSPDALDVARGATQGLTKVVRRAVRGDIMICEMTMPPWTPIFSTISGLVADTGGVLSHCAIVSR